MWANSPGARRWSALATTAISAAALGLAGPAHAAPAAPLDGAPAGGAIERVLAAVAAYADVPDRSALRRRCGTDALCAARLVAGTLGGRASLERVDHPDTDTIRRVHTPRSVRILGRLADGTALIALDRFGRTAERELRQAISTLAASSVMLDLRANRGGDFERMLRVAGLLTGPVAGALHVVGIDGRGTRAIPDSGRIAGVRGLTVVVGGDTASSGEMLAALLRRHAGAEIVGRRTRGKDYLVRMIPVHHDWRLALAAERVEIVGEDLTGGLRPDRPAPALAPR